MRKLIKNSIRNNAYLLIGAIWLYVLSLIFSNYWSYTSSAQGVRKNLEKYIWSQERDAKEFLNDSSLIFRLANNEVNEKENIKLVSRNYGIFIYNINRNTSYELKYWNTQLILPDKSILQKKVGHYVQNMENGQYDLIINDLTIKKQQIRVFVLIPIHWDFFIENKYLKNGFVNQLNADRNFEITTTPTKYPIRSLNGRILYFINEKNESRIYQNDWITIILRILSVLLFMLFINEFGKILTKRFGRIKGILGFILIIISLRFFTYIIDFPFDFRQFELFSPTIYSSDFIFKSLGDLIINAILFLWIIIFIRNQLSNDLSKKIPASKYSKILLIGLLIGLYSLLTILFGLEIQNLVSDSSISFDVANYLSLNIFTLFGFLALCLLAIGYSIITQIIFNFIYLIDKVKMIFQIITNFIFGILILNFVSKEFELFHFCILVWMVLYFISSDNSILKGRFSISINHSIRWLFVYSFMITLVISAENNKKELLMRIRAAEKIAWKADPFTEKYFTILLSGISNNFWVECLEKSNSKEILDYVHDSIPLLNASSSLYKFQTNIYFFDSIGNSLTEGTLDLSSLNQLYLKKSKNTSFEGLRYFETDLTHFSYIYQKSVRDHLNNLKGYVFIVSNPHKLNTASFIPELFKINDPYSIYKNSIYSYAIYNKGILVANYNNYSFRSDLTRQEMNFKDHKIQKNSDVSKVWYKSGDNLIVIIVRKSNFYLDIITLFAYSFCIFLILFGLIKIAGFIVESGFDVFNYKKYLQFDIKTQIFYTIILMSLISFLLIAFTTIYFFNDRYKKNNEERISKTIKVMSEEFSNDLQFELNKNFENNNIDDKLRERILEIAEIHNVDVNIYDLKGDMIVSTQPLVYTKGVLSKKMNPVAFHNLDKQSKVQFLQNEKTGSLNFFSAYTPFFDKNLRKIAYINIPYFTARQDLNQEISNFLVALINLNTFIFLIAGLIAVFITLRITSSFEWIGMKMREVNIGTNNELISWRWNDEIGGLVNEYNKMVLKLDESVKSLAKTEREGAWREMAKQVAHEIKNPLTPMKLSIQFLQRSIDTNAVNVKELTASVAKTLIEQIEHLSKIASEFSHFANIGNVNSQKLEINSIVTSIVSFHANQDHHVIEWKPFSGEVFINADRTQINRLLNNLIRNAIEAIPDKQKGKISISSKIEKEILILEICDNGKGIPDNLHDKIFSPNFTTKTSGTGLGLAICKGIVEQAKGNIWFISNTSTGTCFYVSFPIIPVT